MHVPTSLTYIVLGPPHWMGACLDGAGWLPGGLDIPELDCGIMATGGEVSLTVVAPVQSMNLVHVS